MESNGMIVNRNCWRAELIVAGGIWFIERMIITAYVYAMQFFVNHQTNVQRPSKLK